MEFDHATGFGRDGKAFFWIGKREPRRPDARRVRLPGPASVDIFHGAGVAAGGTDNGAPGVRAHYHPNYYGAYVLDPDGNNIEAVCHAPA